ncbi:hypothetical protein COU37_02845 [Candidatus Micrarchaeota archaeon CG10_big_fil_rev_8_21_14_0_10_45_29]|nr:MAG: hypothetical protein COU37_02845 [Candidatus Micrarchaeota archaeon CG10_big_fil_rev_8_21_14_0_10_45_29]
MAPNRVFYDVDMISDVLELISVDPTIADASVKKKIYTFNKDDMVLVKKEFSGALKITEVKKMDADFISSALK